MPSFEVKTPQHTYPAIVERGILSRASEYLPAKTGKVFVVTTDDVWRHQGAALTKGLSGKPHGTLFLPGGESQKRLAPVEAMAEEMVRRGADRSSLVLAAIALIIIVTGFVFHSRGQDQKPGVIGLSDSCAQAGMDVTSAPVARTTAVKA